MLRNIRKHLRSSFGHFAIPTNGATSTEKLTFAWHKIECGASGFTEIANQFVGKKIAGRNVNGKEGSKRTIPAIYQRSTSEDLITKQ